MSSADLVKVSQRVQLQLIMRHVSIVSPLERLQLFESHETDDLADLGFKHKTHQTTLLTANPTLGDAPLVWLANDEDYDSLNRELTQSIERLATRYGKRKHTLMQGNCDHFLIVGHVPQAQAGVMALENIGVLFEAQFSQLKVSVDVKGVFITSGLQARPINAALTASMDCADDPLLQYMLIVFNIGHGKAKAQAARAHVQRDLSTTDQQMQEVLPEKTGRKRGTEAAMGARQDRQAAKKPRTAEASNAAHAEGATGPSTSQHVGHMVSPGASRLDSPMAPASLADQPSTSQQALHSDSAAQLGMAQGSKSKAPSSGEHISAANVGVRSTTDSQALLRDVLVCLWDLLIWLSCR